jgi:hypothetical protein
MRIGNPVENGSNTRVALQTMVDGMIRLHLNCYNRKIAVIDDKRDRDDLNVTVTPAVERGKRRVSDVVAKSAYKRKTTRTTRDNRAFLVDIIVFVFLNADSAHGRLPCPVWEGPELASIQSRGAIRGNFSTQYNPFNHIPKSLSTP